MKLFMTSIVLCTGLLASFSAEVKRDSVVLQINKEIKTYTKGENIGLKSGDIVCFVSGDGRVVIKGENYKKQLSKRSRSCKFIPKLKATSNSIYSEVKNLSNKMVVAFKVSQETMTSGVSTRSVNQETSDIKSLVIPKENYFISLESSTWGPLPIKLEIFDTKGLLIDTLINEEDSNTVFILPTNRLKDGYSLKVTNVFDDVLLESKVKID